MTERTQASEIVAVARPSEDDREDVVAFVRVVSAAQGADMSGLPAYPSVEIAGISEVSYEPVAFLTVATCAGALTNLSETPPARLSALPPPQIPHMRSQFVPTHGTQYGMRQAVDTHLGR